MAEWWIRFLDSQTGNVQGEYSVQAPNAEIRNSEPGGISCELALGQTKRGSDVLGIRANEFAPYASNYELRRGNMAVPISDGMVTSANLNFNRDSVLVAGKDWKHYLQRRIYPFSPEDYVTYSEDAAHSYWDKWPKKWVAPPFINGQGNPVPVARIIRDLLMSMRKGQPFDYTNTLAQMNAVPNALGTAPIVWNINVTQGPTSKHIIYPGDQTTIYDHIQKFSESSDGFEWDILPGSLEFRMWQPKKYQSNVPVYTWTATDDEGNGAFTEFDWTNEGPDGTYLIGVGSGEYKAGAVWTYEPSLEAYGRLDLTYDYGKMQDVTTILQKLKDQNDLHPQKRLALTLSNPEFLNLNFYTGDRPRSLIGNTVRVTHNFVPYHLVDAYFQINAIRWTVDESTNEEVALELMMIYEPEGTSGGIPHGA
jgi:hypothetical protein